MITLFRERLTEDQLQKLVLNERQTKAMTYLKEKGKISNTEYQNLNKVSKATATRDLVELEKTGLLINKGTKGSSDIYVLDNTYGGEPIGGDFI
jgi:ATP-dependent DNA helicase RecG